MTAALNLFRFVLALIGIWLFWRALSKHRLGDRHPHCWQCGFDLFGLPPTRVICPQCGTPITPHNAVIQRIRQARPQPLVVAIFFAIVLIVTFFPPVRQRLVAFDPTPYKPEWWLLHDVQNRADSARAIAELQLRFDRGTLSSYDKVVKQILAIQRDPQFPWSPSAGDFVVSARSKGLVNDQYWDAFLQGAVAVEPGSQAKGKSYTVSVRELRGPNRSHWSIDIDPRSFEFLGRPAMRLATPARLPTAPPPQLRVPGEISGMLPLPDVWIADLIDRPTKLRMTFDLLVAETSPDGGVAVLLGSTTHRGITFDYLSKSRDVEPLSNRIGADDWERTIQIHSNDPEFADPCIVMQEGRPVFVLTADAPPLDIAAVVVLIDEAGNRWPLTELYAPRGERLSCVVAGWTATAPAWQEFKASRAAVRIEYSPYLAQQSSLPGAFLDFTKTISDVPVRRRATTLTTQP